MQLVAAEVRWDGHEGQDTQVNAASVVRYSLLESVDNKCTGRKDTIVTKTLYVSIGVVGVWVKYYPNTGNTDSHRPCRLPWRETPRTQRGLPGRRCDPSF